MKDSRDIFNDNFQDEGRLKKINLSKNLVDGLKKRDVFPSIGLMKEIATAEGRDNLQFDQELESLSIPFRVGNKVSIFRTIVAIILIFFISELFTGFGYLSVWILIFVFILGIIIVLPGCFSPYWIINLNSITKFDYSSNNFLKFLQLLGIKNKLICTFNYNDIGRVIVKYQSKQRISPFDFTTDYFNLIIVLKDGEMAMTVDKHLQENLLLFINFLNLHNVIVEDPQHVLDVIKNGENIFEHFSKK